MCRAAVSISNRSLPSFLPSLPAFFSANHFTVQRNLRLEAGRKQLAKKLAKIKAGVAGRGAGGEGGGDSGEYGISWGFDEDAVAEDEDEDGEGMEGDDGEVMVSLSYELFFFCVWACGCCIRMIRVRLAS